MKKIFLLLTVFTLAVILSIGSLTKKNTEAAPVAELKEKYSKPQKPSADHSKFIQLKKKFTAPEQVTEACISCHTERHKEVMKSSHWNWEREEYIEGRGIRYVGKKNILNNFCIGISSNEQSCNKCHIGYGWGDAKFNFNDSSRVDCLACHDNSNAYIKQSAGAGMPDPSVNLSYVAQHVGKPLRTNCGTCHFFSGGGNNVKHGDLESALFDPSRDVDVHMAGNGVNLQCVDCHTAEKHQMLGKMYSVSSMNRNRSTCEQCHGELPHKSDVINEHTIKVACQTCHIPEYAKVNSTKMYWDWSTAGKLKNGEPYEETDSLDNDVYMSIKGSFYWERNVKPEYIWFNGTASHYLMGDSIKGNGPVQMNTLYGDYNDPEAKIIPVKIHRANQIYDPVYKTLIQPHTYGAKKGEGAFWQDFNWKTSAASGMKAVNLPFSGKYDFIQTEMYWPVNHMVSPKEKAVQCNECHTRENSRIGNLRDFYMPGRDSNAAIEWFGIGAIVISLVGISVHGTMRIVMKKKNRKEKNS
ncbi:MAG: tetrathionate reductase family octaheme c-type cytochrome [Bacteroidetes bacterium]|nr:tetrathionate reductase family octaheme c-type cytochrome [Bacteroidota bacterium]